MSLFADEIKDIHGKPKERLEFLRDFCLELSESASAQQVRENYQPYEQRLIA